MQAKVADMYVALNSARAYVYAVAKACDAGQTTRFDAAGAILLASENAVKVSLEAVQALGGAGYTKEWPVERLVRDAKLYDIGAGTNEIRRFLIGRELIGATRRRAVRAQIVSNLKAISMTAHSANAAPMAKGRLRLRRRIPGVRAGGPLGTKLMGVSMPRESFP
jgi:hypothetical protein